jgi:hypothetical protein
MNLAFLTQMRAYPTEPLGRLAMFAKSGTTDNDVRRTWILFGDPAMKLQFVPSSIRAGSAPPTSTQPPTRVYAPRAFLKTCTRGIDCASERQKP